MFKSLQQKLWNAKRKLRNKPRWKRACMVTRTRVQRAGDETGLSSLYVNRDRGEETKEDVDKELDL